MIRIDAVLIDGKRKQAVESVTPGRSTGSCSMFLKGHSRLPLNQKARISSAEGKQESGTQASLSAMKMP